MSAEAYRFDEFVIDSMIGEGGMGKVFRARQVSLDRWVALKVLLRAKESGGSFTDRFRQEARSAAKLVHPNIIQVYTVGEHEGVPYFAMEYVEGMDLERLQASDPDPLTNDEICEILRALLKALVLASEHGMVHRDIKPANIMISRSGMVKVMDFGLAKGLESSGMMTQSGLIVGTPSYMSPEQGASKPVDERSDLYSLGCVLYTAITGKPPFQADNVAALIFKHAYENAEAPSKLRPDADPDVEQICIKLMAKNPEDRYQSAEDALIDLSRVPSNPTAAEISLGKRAQKQLAAKKGKESEQTIITAEAFLGRPAGKSSATVPSVAHPIPPPGAASFLKKPGAPVAAPPVQAPAAPPTVPSTASFLGKTTAAPSAPISAEDAAPPAVPKGPGLLTPPPPPPHRPGHAGGSNIMTSVTDSGLRRKVFRIEENFIKMADGRWSYRAESGPCKSAEGLASTLPQAPGQKSPLGDCLLCSNWSKRAGCVLAACQYLERNPRYQGLKLIIEQSLLWAGIGRFEKAIALLDNYVKIQPGDPGGYRELARVYDRPDYHGRDKRRAVVLYQRFAELAAEKEAGYSKLEIQRAQERAEHIAAMPPDNKTTVITPSMGVAFQCFYRGPVIAFVFGLLLPEKIILFRAGEVDPDSGIQAADMGGAMNRATSIFRRMKSEQAKRDEQALVKKELSRLADLPLESMQDEPARILTVPLDTFTDVRFSVDQAIGIRSVHLTAPQSFALLFTETSAFKAEQCHELLRRRISANKKV